MKINSGRKLLSAIDKYLLECSERDADRKKATFANVAGFCRSAGIPVSRFREFEKEFPEEFGIAGAYFEDAALNSGATASLISLYLKQYGIWGDEHEGSELECDHDLYADGV